MARTSFPHRNASHNDIVIVIDDSNPMRTLTLDGRTYQSIAVEGALAVLETLNSRDRVSIADRDTSGVLLILVFFIFYLPTAEVLFLMNGLIIPN